MSMSLPPADRTDPRDVAQSAATLAVFHEVVMGTSKVIHNQALDPRDQKALVWARGLIEFAANTDVVYAMPSATQLAGSTQAAIALRRALQPPDGEASGTLRSIRDAVDAALAGDRTEEVREQIGQLRSLFTAISQLALRSEVAAHGGAAWRTSPRILPS
jgi:hypothetical protein